MIPRLITSFVSFFPQCVCVTVSAHVFHLNVGHHCCTFCSSYFVNDARVNSQCFFFLSPVCVLLHINSVTATHSLSQSAMSVDVLKVLYLRYSGDVSNQCRRVTNYAYYVLKVLYLCCSGAVSGQCRRITNYAYYIRPVGSVWIMKDSVLFFPFPFRIYSVEGLPNLNLILQQFSSSLLACFLLLLHINLKPGKVAHCSRYVHINRN